MIVLRSEEPDGLELALADQLADAVIAHPKLAGDLRNSQIGRGRRTRHRREYNRFGSLVSLVVLVVLRLIG